MLRRRSRQGLQQGFPDFTNTLIEKTQFNQLLITYLNEYTNLRMGAISLFTALRRTAACCP